ncbi:MAG: UbiA family prenyltransferase [Methanoregula sp.]|jgi:4-hydroxybenzoate polyprenyltransferase|nr:UbiA family prenyltransferase [Methanoregula sp.]
MNAILRAYTDLLRLQFSFAWPLLFCSGYLLATMTYGGFEWFMLAKVALIGFFGFEAGLVLNDYVDREIDKKDVDAGRLTKYWRLFGTRPLPAGLIPPKHALALFGMFAGIAAVLILTLPYPHSAYVLLMMAYCYVIEVFYQEEKRIPQVFPFPQVIGRTDFALFPVAGYICAGLPNITALLYFIFFYPFALAHLGLNDLIDEANDRARGLRTIPTIYDTERTRYWIAGFTVIHAIMASVFLTRLGPVGQAGIYAGLVLLVIANVVILKYKTPDAALKVLPLFHVAMVLYAGGICAGALLAL